MSFVKVLYGTMVTSDFTLGEGKVGFTESDYLYQELEAKGICKLFPSKAEAEAYKFKSSMELFHESFKSLNPPEGEAVPAPTLDFEKCAPVVTDGVPSNIIAQPVIETAPVAPTVNVVPDAPVTDSKDDAPVTDTSKK